MAKLYKKIFSGPNTNRYVLRIELYARIFRLVLPLTTHIIFTQLREIERERDRYIERDKERERERERK